MVVDLEGATPKDEVVEPTPSEEVKPTPLKEEPTVRVYTQKELDEAVGKGQSSINKQLSLSKAEARKAQAEAGQFKANITSLDADIASLTQQYDSLAAQQFTDDPDAMKAFKDRQGIERERRDVAKAKAEAESKLYEAEKLAWSVNMARRANDLNKEYGIDVAELEACQTEEEMEVKALRFQLGKKEPESGGKPKFDSGKSSGAGVDFNKMTPDEKLKHGFRQLKK